MSRLTGAQADSSERVHPVDEVLPPGRLAVYGFQHLLAFYAAFVVMPLLVAEGVGLSAGQTVYLVSASIFACGIATLIQSVGFWKVGIRMPIVLGTSLAAVAPMITIGQAAGGGVSGILAVYGAVILSGIATFFIAPYFGRLIRFFPPVVTGTVITVIGLSLLPVAIEQAGGGDAAASDFGSLSNLALAAGTLTFIILIYRFFSGFLSTIAILLGLVVGTVAATAFGLVDFSEVRETNWVEPIAPFYFGLPTFEFAAVLSMIVVMLIIAVESTGNFFAAGEIVDRPVGEEDIGRGIRAEGLATAISGIFNSFPFTTFSGNVGLVRLTRIKSRWVVATTGVFMLVLGFLPKVAATVAVVPPAVIGAATLALFGTIAVVGIQILARVDFSEEGNLVIVAISLGIGFIPVSFPEFFQNVPEALQILVGSGIIMSTLVAIFLNIIFNHLRKQRADVEAPLSDAVSEADQVATEAASDSAGDSPEHDRPRL